MVWKSEKDEFLWRQILLTELYQYKARNKERGSTLEQKADALKFISTKHTFFRVDAGAVRERCALLKNHQAGKEKSELKQSGISPQDTLLDEAIEI